MNQTLPSRKMLMTSPKGTGLISKWHHQSIPSGAYCLLGTLASERCGECGGEEPGGRENRRAQQ